MRSHPHVTLSAATPLCGAYLRKDRGIKKHVTLSERVPPSESKGLPMVRGSLQPSAGRCRLKRSPNPEEILRLATLAQNDSGVLA